METLVSDCLPPIFSYLSPSDLLHLRSVSRRLKQEVEDHLPTVRSLPLYLTTPRTPEAIARYENMCLSLIDFVASKNDSYNHLRGLRRLPFGTSRSRFFEDQTILQNQNHFRRADFLILNHSSALFKFLPFIKKHCLNIEKLALVIDHCDHYLPEVSKVLEAFPAIKVLLLENTHQDSCRHHSAYIDESDPERFLLGRQRLEKNFVELLTEVYNSILTMNSLEKLYLFSKRQSQFFMDNNFGSDQHGFVRSLLDRLKVLHFNTKFSFKFPVDGEPNGPLEELAFYPDEGLRTKNKPLMFPRLKKLILIKHSSWMKSEYNLLHRSSLKVLDISRDNHNISPHSTQNLNYFTGLERFHCGLMWNYDLEIVPENLKNWTIKHLQVMKGSKTVEERERDARQFSKYFVALETSTFLEPEYSVFHIKDILK